MRKDKGLSGDVDRLPILTWVMFLKFLDDTERNRSVEAELKNEPFQPVIDEPYRWRDWNRPARGLDETGLQNAMTGSELLDFINQDEAIRPDGKRGPGLFAYLRTLDSKKSGNRAEVVASVFRGTVNRMQSGYLLRDVLDKVAEIHFSSSEEIHVLGHLYESLLREMRDAAGDSGEFYTPRPLVRMIIEAIDPQPGETLLDPAAGTGGFLVEAYEHVRSLGETVEEIGQLQESTLYGIEAKPLPYLLCQMNLLLHGVESPRIDPLNALRFRLSEIGDRDRVDVIVTNPPFGGEEEKGIQRNFPADRQTAETALLFLQLIMRKLRRPGDNRDGGRAGVVVPDGLLFADGVAARIKAELVEQFNLHTIVRLPRGVFAPYTPIPTNVLFFDRAGPTKAVWYYEITPPLGRKNYSKTKPIQFEELEEFLRWFRRKKRGKTERAWKVPAKELIKVDSTGALLSVNLDRRNPVEAKVEKHQHPKELVAEILIKEQRIVALLNEIAVELNGESE
jgi:type I restriction enzyme M protein